MKPHVCDLLFSRLQPFSTKAFSVLHPSKTLISLPYIEVTCAMLEGMERGHPRNAIINMPPRSLKTFLCTKTYAAWLLARDPTLEIMIITPSVVLARDIAHAIRKILRSDFYHEVTTTRIAEDRSSVFDFATTKGGGVLTRPIGSSIVGRSADVLITDDVNDPYDAGNNERFEFVIERFDGVISDRLNDASQGRTLVVGSRTGELDLSGHLLRQQSGYEHLSFPVTAPKAQRHSVGKVTWDRQKGEVLRPGTHTEKYLARKRAALHNPDFETLYQQNPEGELALKIEETHFGSFDESELPNTAPVMSVDAGLVAGPDNSYSVIQIWKRQANQHFLVDQWRDQVDYDDLFKMCRRLRQRWRPSHVIIERSALGAALISDAKEHNWRGVVSVVPARRSKAARLRPHAELICSGVIRLPPIAEWRHDFVQEFVRFPHARFSDQVDATTQVLDWVANRPDPKPSEPRAFVGFPRASHPRLWRPTSDESREILRLVCFGQPDPLKNSG